MVYRSGDMSKWPESFEMLSNEQANLLETLQTTQTWVAAVHQPSCELVRVPLSATMLYQRSSTPALHAAATTRMLCACTPNVPPFLRLRC